MKLFRILRAVLREVFDEAAYQRFCEREKLTVGSDSYRKFLVESGEVKNKKISRCC
jgi:hypothetical protein